MNIESLTNYKKGFDLVKIILIVTILGAFSFTAFVVYVAQKENNRLRQSVYIVDKSGNTQVAEEVAKQDVKQFQYEAAVRSVYKLWYEIDENSYEKNTEAALWLLGDCGKIMLKEYKDDRVLYNLKEKNLKLSVEISDVQIDPNKKIGFIKGIQTFIRNNGMRKRTMNCTFSLIDVSPSKKNLFGVKIENWEEKDKSDRKSVV